MRQLRIFLLGMPQIMRDLIRAITEPEPDMAVVGESSGSDSCPTRSIHDLAPGVVIVAMNDTQLPPAGVQLLRDYCAPQVLGLSAGGRTGYLYQLRAHRVALGELSADSLVAILRGSTT